MSLPAHSHTPATVYRMQPAFDFTQERRKARHDKRLQPGARLLFEDVCDLSERDGYLQRLAGALRRAATTPTTARSGAGRSAWRSSGTSAPRRAPPTDGAAASPLAG